MNYRNLEKQIETMRRATSPELDRRTIDDIRAVMAQGGTEKLYQVHLFMGIVEVIMKIMRNGFVQVGVAAAIVIAAGLGAMMLINGPQEEPKKIVDNDPCVVPAAGTPEQVKAAELAAIEKLYELKNTKALALALTSPNPEARLAAANYLALIGDANSVAPLQKAGEEWQGDTAENPFTKAAGAIKQRVDAAGSPEVSPDATAVVPPAPTRDGKAIPDGEALVITVKVLEAGTGRSLAGAKVQGRDSKGTTMIDTDAAGMAQVKVWRDPKYISVVVTCAGHVGQIATWQDEAAGHVPGQQAFKLEKGTIVGGIVNNPEGEPIEAVAVKVYMYYTVPKEDGSPSVYNVRDEMKTDKDGRWQSDVVPADMNNIGISFEHPEYQAAGWGDHSWPEAELRARTSVMVLKHGQRLYGVVRNTAGQPIKNAQILLGDYANEIARSDQDGRFDVRSLKEENQIVTVGAKSYAPVMREVSIQELAVEQVFILGEGLPLNGKVVDANGLPVVEAFIRVEKWQGYRTLSKNMKTDQAGAFEWKNAPAGTMDCQVTAKGYMEAIVTDVVADGQEKVFVLGEPARVTGKVTDAATGEPIQQFELVPGIAWADQRRSISFQSSTGWTKQLKGGKYDYTFDRLGNCYAVRIVAEGYLPAESRIIEPNERLVICDFALQRSAGAKGVVRLPDGKPAAGVTVYMLSATEHLYLQSGKVQGGPDRPLAKTDIEGRFSLSEQVTEYKVFAIGDAGLAMVTSEELKQSGEIKLAAWGRVEGQYFTGTRPAVARQVRMTYPYQGDNWSGTHEAQADEEGKFSFTMVRPGEAEIDGHGVNVMPGETASVVIGGTGRTVTAEIVLSEELAAAVSQPYFSLSVGPRVDEEEILNRIPIPSNIDSMTLAEVVKWLSDYSDTEEGKKLFREMQPQVPPGRLYMPAKVEGGTVTIEDVPAGPYVLEGTMYSVRVGGHKDYEHPAASVYYEFEVPRIEEGQLDLPLDLGKIKVVGKPGIGEMAPNFELGGTDGRTMRLSDHMGKVVLVTLCQSKSGLEDPEITSLKKLYKTYSGEGRFAMIGIVPGPRSHPIMRVMMREMALPWPVGYSSMQKVGRIMQDYGTGQMNMWNVLIGADGKIIASNLKGEELVKKVGEALAASR